MPPILGSVALLEKKGGSHSSWERWLRRWAGLARRTPRRHIGSMTDLERVAANNNRELRAALKAIREVVEDLAPPGSVPNDEYMIPEPMLEAEAIIRGIHAIAGRYGGL
jgi:hypothetical protein